MNSDRPRLGVMGCSRFAIRAMIPVFTASHSVELIAVSSRSAEKAQRVAKQFGCEATKGYESLLARSDLDVIYMPLPTGLHEKWVTRCIESGKHVLVEKSFATSLSSAERMVDIARLNNLLITENFSFQHHSQHLWVTNQLDKDAIGSLRLFRSTFGFPPLPSDDFRYDPGLGGGALLDAGTYVVKAASIFLGPNLKLVGAKLRFENPRGVDISGEAMFVNESGQIAQLSFGFDYYYQCHYELLGTHGKLTAKRAFTCPPGVNPVIEIERENYVETHSLPSDNHFARMIESFVEKVKRPGEYSVHHDTLLQQASLLEMIQMEGAR